MTRGCYYLHATDKALIYKSLDDIPDIRDSDLAIGLWIVDSADRETAWNTLVEALAAGAKKERIQELATKWGCNDTDAIEYARRIKCKLDKDGHTSRAHGKGKIGLGDTYLEAMADLAKRLGYKPSKMWGKHFKDYLKEE